mmetsp:Transcript_7407/g.7271  ORF Transcript_7407/g.7271 Transcript_7407/m.7271 type:complete len:98 (-) Transcript_7407:5-298(-)
MIADTIALMILQVTSNPNTALLQAMNEMELDDKKFKFLIGLLQKRFSHVDVDTEQRIVEVKKGENKVWVHFDNQTVDGDSEILKGCVEEIMRNVINI